VRRWLDSRCAAGELSAETLPVGLAGTAFTGVDADKPPFELRHAGEQRQHQAAGHLRGIRPMGCPNIYFERDVAAAEEGGIPSPMAPKPYWNGHPPFGLSGSTVLSSKFLRKCEPFHTVSDPSCCMS